MGASLDRLKGKQVQGGDKPAFLRSRSVSGTLGLESVSPPGQSGGNLEEPGGPWTDSHLLKGQ